MFTSASGPGANRLDTELSSTALHTKPLVYWKQNTALREMASSYLASVSHWVVPGCEPMFLDLYEAFASVQSHPARQRMHAVIIQGGGRMVDTAAGLQYAAGPGPGPVRGALGR